MGNSTSNFTTKITQLEQSLETIYTQSTEQFPNQPQQQIASFLESMKEKINQLLEEIPEENKEDFQSYIKEKLNLKDEADIKNFTLSAPKQIEDLVKSGFGIN